MRDIVMPLAIDEIAIEDGRRDVDSATVKRLADSIDNIGLRHPITVRKKGEQYVLVAGRHRIEAFKKLEREHIPACIVSMTHAESRMWEIAENLHRAELSKLERAEQIEEWRKLSIQGVKHLPPVGGVQPNEKGIGKTADTLGVSEHEVRVAERLSSLTSEAKEAAEEAGFADNQSKLLEIAKEPPSRQLATVHELAERRTSGIDRDVKYRAAHSVAELIAEYVPSGAWDGLKANLYAAGAANVAHALTNITGEAIMDRSFK